MEILLVYAVLYGALQALVIALAVAIIPVRTPGHWALIGMMASLGLWQTQTALGLLDIRPTIIAVFSLVHFPAMFAFPALFSAYLARLFFRDSPVARDMLIAAGLAAFAVVAMLVCLVIAPHDATSWRDAAVATWSTCTGPMDERLRALSYVPRPLSILAGAAVMARVFATQLKEPILRRLRLGATPLLGLALAGTALSQYAFANCDLRGATHAWGAALISLSVAGVFVLNHRLGRFLDPEQRAGRIHSLLAGVDDARLAEVLHDLMKNQHIYRVENLSLHALAAAVTDEGLRVSPKQLSEFVNLRFGRNFNAYVNGYRIQEACTLLRDTADRSVLTIAMQVGFNSKSTFNSVFKEAIGVSPSVYRADRSK